MSSSSQILNDLLQQSPAAELSVVLQSLQTIVDGSSDPAALASGLGAALTAFHADRCSILAPGVVCSRFGLLDEANGLFYDPAAQKEFTVDGTAVSAASNVADRSYSQAEISLGLPELQAKLNEHIKQRFEGTAPGVATGGLLATSANVSAASGGADEARAVAYLLDQQDASSADSFGIVIRSAKSSARNFWSGSWTSVYRYQRSTGSLQGEIRVSVHLYEDGNVMLNPSMTVHEPNHINTTDDLLRAMDRAETAFHAAIEETCASMSSTTLKSLRRVLPITGDKFDFGSAAHSLASELAGGGKY